MVEVVLEGYDEVVQDTPRGKKNGMYAQNLHHGREGVLGFPSSAFYEFFWWDCICLIHIEVICGMLSLWLGLLQALLPLW